MASANYPDERSSQSVIRSASHRGRFTAKNRMNTTNHPFMTALKGVTTLVKKDKSVHHADELLTDRETILVFAGAGHLCGPSKRTLEGLKAFYKTINNPKECEILYLSQDSNHKEFEKHFSEAHSDWFALEPNDAAMAGLMKTLDNPTPPHIFVFNKMGYLVRRTTGVRDLTDANSKGAVEKWKKRTEPGSGGKKDKAAASRESRESKDE